MATLESFREQFTEGAGSYPAGARFLLAEASARRKWIESSIVSVLTADDFRELTIPLIDFAEPYVGVVPDELLRRSYRFTDREGALLLLRSDFTPMVARALAPTLGTLPVRVFYRGEVIRADDLRSPAGVESFQIGAELIGGDAAEDDFALLEVLARICKSLGIRATLAVSDVRLIDAVLRGASEDDAIRKSLRRVLQSKRRDELLPLVSSLQPAIVPVVEKFLRGSLRVADLLECETTEEVAVGLARLEGQLAGLASPGFRTALAIDSIDGGADYYTGIRFHLFVDGQSTPIASGGRYDALYRRFGGDAGAAGFTFNVDVLERAR